MKKIFLCLILLFTLFAVVSCSEKSKAKRIYNSNKDDITKMDELIELYFSSVKTKDYSDAAWKQIQKGNYDVALGLIYASGTTGGYDSLSYLFLLQKDLPEYTGFYIDIKKDSRGNLSWDWDFSYPSNIKLNSLNYQADIYHQISIVSSNGYMNNYDTGQGTIHKFSVPIEKNSKGGYDDLEITVTLTAVPGIITSYYKATTYTYSCCIENVENNVGRHNIIK